MKDAPSIPNYLKVRSRIGSYIGIAIPFLVAIIAVIIWGKQPTADDFQVVILFSVIPFLFWIWFATLQLEVKDGVVVYSQFFIKRSIQLGQIKEFYLSNRLKRSGPIHGLVIVPKPESRKRKFIINCAPFKTKEFKMFITILKNNCSLPE
ncbi:MAG: hypothetical protein KGL98_00610 [Gammaproteobacteria bacterium]|nr:hypothetical protein [Gammaproteobacteria bacterium]